MPFVFTLSPIKTSFSALVQDLSKRVRFWILDLP